MVAQLDAASPPDLVPRLLQRARSIVEANQRTEPSPMAALTPPPAGQINLTTAQHNQLDSVIAASWS